MKYNETASTEHFRKLPPRPPAYHLRRSLGPQKLTIPRIYWQKLLVNYGEDHLAMRDDQYIEWRDGRTYTADGHELMYLHFHRLKATIKTCNFTYGDRPRRIRLSRHEILGD